MSSRGEQRRLIAVEGPIGVGKTTLARMLAEYFKGKIMLEAVEENPFLARFYQDPEKNAFSTQVFFLLSRYRQQQELLQQDLFRRMTITDYLFHKDRIFAQLTLGDDELFLYEQIYNLLEPRIRRPDLVIYLQAPPDVLMQRVKSRNLEYEQGLSRGYLGRISEAYQRFFFQWNATPLLVVDTSRLDFVHNEADFSLLLKEIDHTTRGVNYFIPRAAT